jgi:hypothetical protein
LAIGDDAVEHQVNNVSLLLIYFSTFQQTNKNLFILVNIMKLSGTNLISGLALGGLVGLLIGLSISEVVGAVLGALTSLLVVFFGLKDGSSVTNLSKSLISAFCMGCIIFLIIGMILRTRGLLSPSVEFYQKELADLHLDSNQVKEIILLKKYGITYDEPNKKNLKFDEKAIAPSSVGSLFSSEIGKDETEQLVEKFEKMPYDSLVSYISKNGRLFNQFTESLDVDIPADTVVKKRILLQLIVITYKN